MWMERTNDCGPSWTLVVHDRFSGGAIGTCHGCEASNVERRSAPVASVVHARPPIGARLVLIERGFGRKPHGRRRQASSRAVRHWGVCGNGGWMLGRAMPENGSGRWWEFVRIVTDLETVVTEARELAGRAGVRACLHEGKGCRSIASLDSPNSTHSNSFPSNA